MEKIKNSIDATNVEDLKRIKQLVRISITIGSIEAMKARCGKDADAADKSQDLHRCIQDSVSLKRYINNLIRAQSIPEHATKRQEKLQYDKIEQAQSTASHNGARFSFASCQQNEFASTSAKSSKKEKDVEIEKPKALVTETETTADNEVRTEWQSVTRKSRACTKKVKEGGRQFAQSCSAAQQYAGKRNKSGSFPRF